MRGKGERRPVNVLTCTSVELRGYKNLRFVTDCFTKSKWESWLVYVRKGNLWRTRETGVIQRWMAKDANVKSYGAPRMAENESRNSRQQQISGSTKPSKPCQLSLSFQIPHYPYNCPLWLTILLFWNFWGKVLWSRNTYFRFCTEGSQSIDVIWNEKWAGLVV